MMRRVLGIAAAAALLLVSACSTQTPVREPASSPGSPVSAAPKPHPVRPPGAAASTPVPLANPSEKDYAPTTDEIPDNLKALPDAVPQNEDRSPYGNPSSYEVYGKRYEIMSDARGFRERGYASWYGKKFHGKRTSSGVPYDMYSMTGAHKTLPIPTYVRVTSVANGKSVIVKINDRGPFHDGRIVDLSYAAALKLDMLSHGSTLVELEVVTPGEPATPVAVAANAPEPQAAATTVEKPPLQTEPPPVIVAQPAPLHAGTPRYLQAGVFGDAVNAAAFREKLATAGVKPLLMKSETRNSRWVYRVLVGPFADTPQLEAARSKLSADATPTIPVVD